MGDEEYAGDEGGFLCTALTDYFAAAADELDLRAGAVYTIIQTSESGWWYAEDEDGQDGWCPSNYLVRLDEDEEDWDEEEEQDSDEDVDLTGLDTLEVGAAATPGGGESIALSPSAVGYADEAGGSALSLSRKKSGKGPRVLTMSMDDSDEGDGDRGGGGGASGFDDSASIHSVHAASLAKMKQWEQIKKKQAEKQRLRDEEEARKAEERRIQEEEEQRRRAEQEAIEKANEEERLRLEEERRKREMEEQRRKEAEAEKERLRLEALKSEEQKQQEREERKREKKRAKAEKKKEKQRKKAEKALIKYDAEKAALEKAKQDEMDGGMGGGGAVFGSVSPSGRSVMFPVKGMKVIDIVTYLESNFPDHGSSSIDKESINMFQLKSVLTRVSQLAANHREEREELGKSGCLDKVLRVLKYMSKDLAICMACCTAISTMCHGGCATRYPASAKNVQYLSAAIKGSYRNAIFCYEAFKCICNFTHMNTAHKKIILEDPMNREIIECVIEGMEKFRYVEEVHKKEHCRRVTMSGCLALQNLASDTMGRQMIGSAGVESLLGALIAHIEDMEVIEKCLQTLKNLVVLVTNSESFINEDGMEYIRTLVSDPDIPKRIRRMCADVLANIFTSPALCTKMCNDRNTIDTMCVFIQTTEPDIMSYPAVLRLINPFLIRQSKASIRKELIHELIDNNLLMFITAGLTHDWSQPPEIDEESEYMDYATHTMGKSGGLLLSDTYSIGSATHQHGRPSTSSALSAAGATEYKWSEPTMDEVGLVMKEVSVLIKLIVSTKDKDFIEDLVLNEIAEQLINVCLDYGPANKSLLENSFAVYFFLLDNVSLHETLVGNGLAFLLFESEWHLKGLSKNPSKLAMGSMVKLVKTFEQTQSEWDIDEAAANAKPLIEWASSIPELKSVSDTLDRHIKAMQLKMG